VPRHMDHHHCMEIGTAQSFLDYFSRIRERTMPVTYSAYLCFLIPT